MYFEFYPNADGLMIESSDYSICHCPECKDHFFDKEFGFVSDISEEVWRHKPRAMVVVYPHYFSGSKVPGFEVSAATQAFDPRWTLFFTPHSAHLEPKLIRKARSSLWWDDAPALSDPQAIQRGAKKARDAGVSGYIPSLEAYSYIPTHPEDGEQYLVGRRQVPFGFGWLKEDQMPYGDLPIRVNRIAYREFAKNPDLAFEQFKRKLAEEIFGQSSAKQSVDDLLEIQRVFSLERTWCQTSPLVTPQRLAARSKRGELKPDDLRRYRAILERIKRIELRYAESSNAGEKELHRIAGWIMQQWTGENGKLLLST